MSDSEKGILLDTHAWIWLFNGDPADKIIVATARMNDLILLTRDKKILNYGEQSHVNCFKV